MQIASISTWPRRRPRSDPSDCSCAHGGSAKGAGTFGRFEVTADVSASTKAAVFQPGAKTETLIRFSTVAGERGSPDTWRDPRSFALKFYTTEGNYEKESPGA